MGTRKIFLINELVKYSQKLDQKGFVANHDGNISVKFDDVLLATPTAISKGNMIADIAITLDTDGKKIEGMGQPFSEIKLHLAAYSCRHDINAVIHAHPPFSTAFGLTGKELVPNLPEAIVSIGDIVPVVPFAMPGSPESMEYIADAFQKVNVAMLAGNGVLAIGESIEQAYLRLELVEHLAKIQFYAHKLGSPMVLSQENIDQLLEKRRAAGLEPPGYSNHSASVKVPSNPPPIDRISELIAEEIRKALK